jgi:gamma-butyrobetaine dioxygenase
VTGLRAGSPSSGGRGAGGDPISVIARLFATEGANEYLGEAVTQASHMLQTAALAKSSGARPPLIAAALLHDVGHFTAAVSGHDLMRGTDNRHSEAGADWLAQWFGPEVTEPVRLHVAAKRYLCAVEPGYAETLSPASVYTLAVQGGPMDAAERASFEAHPRAHDALRLRRWDDAAKDPAATPPAFGYYQPMLRRLLRDQAPRAAR